MRVSIVAAFALAGLLLLPATGAFAAGAGAISTTQVFKDATQIFASPNPCTGAPGTVTITFNGVFHITTLANGTFWATGTQTGTFTFTPDDPTQLSASGRFTAWFGDNDNLKNGTETSILSVRGTNADGTTFVAHDVAHVSVSASGITFSFDKPTCH